MRRVIDRICFNHRSFQLQSDARVALTSVGYFYFFSRIFYWYTLILSHEFPA
jgi:hypothetical protein